MPVTIRKVKGGFRVRNAGRVTAKRTTLRKAKRQRRLLRVVKHNPGFRARRR